MRPPIDKFAEVMNKTRGNLSQVAKAFGVTRGAVYKWIYEDPAYAEVRDDARGAFLDEVVATSRVVALGIPMTDQDGNFAGYQVAPDSSMLRYLMGTLGRNEGFGERLEVDTTVRSKYYPKDPQDAKDYLEFLQMKYPERTRESLRRLEEYC